MKIRLEAVLSLFPFALMGYFFALVIGASGTDYLVHIQIAQKMVDSHHIQTPHFIFQVALILISKFLSIQ